ncbi:MAG: hypothetical protein FWG10_12510 [Eubacteriaceae bacterium]|nr:hypothetical protein [Eubacteriaceae bacterium]
MDQKNNTGKYDAFTIAAALELGIALDGDKPAGTQKRSSLVRKLVRTELEGKNSQKETK